MPGVDVGGAADALAEREAGLVDELGEDPAADQPGPVADPLGAAPERREEALGRGGRRGRGGRACGSARPARRRAPAAGRKKPADAAARVRAESGAASHSSSCGPPCSGGSSSPAPQSTIRAGTSPSASHGVQRLPAGRGGRVEQPVGELGLARHHDDAVAAAGGSGAGGSGGRPGGYVVPARARTCARAGRTPPSAPRAATAASAARPYCS